MWIHPMSLSQTPHRNVSITGSLLSKIIQHCALIVVLESKPF